MKGLICFLTPETQMRHCLDLMEKVWKQEDAELKAREELWIKMKKNVWSIIHLSPKKLDSFERCSKRLKMFQQLKSLFMTKSCEGALRNHVKAIDILVSNYHEGYEQIAIHLIVNGILDYSKIQNLTRSIRYGSG